MSKGLDKIERKIKEYLEKEKSCTGNKKLTKHVFSHINDDMITESEYQSVCRAVRSLKRKGKIETWKESSNTWSEDYYEKFHSKYDCNWLLYIYWKGD